MVQNNWLRLSLVRSITMLFVLVYFSQQGVGQARLVLPPNQLRADLEQMRAILETWHPGYAYYRSTDSLRQRFLTIGRQIEKPMTVRQFIRTARLASAQIQCLHTSVSLPVNKEQSPAIPIGSPLTKIYLTPNHQLISRLTGDTIRQLNGRSGEVVADSLLLFFTSDGPNQSLKRWAVNRQFATVYTALFGRVDTLHVSIDTPKGLVAEKYAAIMPRPDSMATYLAEQPHTVLRQYRHFALYTLNQHPGVAVLQWRSVGGSGDQGRLKRVIRLLRKQSVQRLVLDMRNNTGGRIWTATSLLARLLPEPATITFERYKRANGPEALGVGNQVFRFLYGLQLALRTSVTRTEKRIRYTYTIKPKKNAFDGQLTVLTNGGTASAASLAAAYLREQNRATFIGEETGGSRFVSAGMQVPTFHLKYSGLRLKVPLFQVIHAAKLSDNGHGVQPDIVVNEWQLNKDRVMAKALE